MSLSVVTTNNQTGTQTVTVRPVSVSIGQVFTLQLFGVSVSFTATAATAANVVAGLLAAINASSDPEWDLVDSELNQAGDALLISYSVTGGDLKIWRGDAEAVAQVTRVTPSSVEVGDVFTLAINGKEISVTATVNTAANVVDLFVAAISSSTLEEWNEVTATDDGNSMLLTANVAGVPFVVTGSSSNFSTLGVTVTTTSDGSPAVPAVNSTQTFRIPLTADGTFTIVLGNQITSGIAVGASASTVQTAITGLSTVGSGNASVAKSSDVNDDIYVVTFQGSLAGLNVATMIINLTTAKPIVRTIQGGSSSGTPRNEKQTLTFATGWVFGSTIGYTFTLTLDGQTTSAIDARSNAASIQSFINGLSNVDDGTVIVTTDGNVATFEFTGTEGQTDQPQLVASVFSGSNTHVIAIAVTSSNAVAAIPAVNEVQTVRVTGSPSGGTFTLRFGANTTAGLAYDASASTVQTALQGLASIGSGNATVSGSSGGPWTVTFAGSLAGANQNQLIADGTGLTGGTTNNVTLSTVTPSSGPFHWDTAANWIPAGVPVDFDRVRFEFGSSDVLYGLDQSGITLTEIEISSGYTGSIGLPRLNSNGYVEYRTRDLTVNCPSILIGHGNGAGSGKIQLNTLETTVWMEIRNSGGSRESGVPAITWFGDNEASEIVLLNGDFGVAIWSDQSATLNSVKQYGGTLRLDHASLNFLYAPGQSVSAHETTLGGKPLEL
jgi:hypothetical protein